MSMKTPFIYIVFLLTACVDREAERIKKETEIQKGLENTVRAHLEKWTNEPADPTGLTA